MRRREGVSEKEGLVRKRGNINGKKLGEGRKKKTRDMVEKKE